MVEEIRSENAKYVIITDALFRPRCIREESDRLLPDGITRATRYWQNDRSLSQPSTTIDAVFSSCPRSLKLVCVRAWLTLPPADCPMALPVSPCLPGGQARPARSCIRRTFVSGPRAKCDVSVSLSNTIKPLTAQGTHTGGPKWDNRCLIGHFAGVGARSILRWLLELLNSLVDFVRQRCIPIPIATRLLVTVLLFPRLF